MFGIGVAELVMIFVIALLVMGPQRFPEVARTLGRALRELQRMTRDIMDEFEVEARVLSREKEETKHARTDR